LSVPNVNCKILYVENEETLAKYPTRNERYGPKRKFYSCNQAQDYVTYVDTGSKQDYISYSGDREKSTGIFGKNGLLGYKERVALRKKLRTTKSIIWDCLLTFQPEFGQTYCNNYEQAYEMMKCEMPRFLKDAGFNPDNITWFAGLHTNKRHRHIHISFFENEPTRLRKRSKELQYSLGKINRACLDRFKIHVEQNLTDISAELRIARKDVTTLTQNVLFSKDCQIRYNSEFQSLILRLAESLPSEGRLSYDSENMYPLKPLIRQITDIAIKSNRKWHKAFLKFCGEVKRHDDETREMLIRNKVPEKYRDRYLKSETYLEDLYRRMGNQILNYVRVYKKKERPAKSRLARKRIRNKTAFDVLSRSAQLQAAMEADSMFFFEEYLKKLEEAREENAQGVMELDEME
jgi:hypothetical protein